METSSQIDRELFLADPLHEHIPPDSGFTGHSTSMKPRCEKLNRGASVRLPLLLERGEGRGEELISFEGFRERCFVCCSQ